MPPLKGTGTSITRLGLIQHHHDSHGAVLDTSLHVTGCGPQYLCQDTMEEPESVREKKVEIRIVVQNPMSQGISEPGKGGTSEN